MYRLLVADLDSPSYFVATAAVELGCFKQEGIDVELVRDYGAEKGPDLLRDGMVHFLGGPAYVAIRAFPNWKGAKLLCALSQYSYWFLAVRADLNLGITTYGNGTEMNPVQLDTSQVATDTIDYVATDSSGNTATSTRTVLIEAATAATSTVQ